MTTIAMIGHRFRTVEHSGICERCNAPWTVGVLCGEVWLCWTCANEADSQ